MKINTDGRILKRGAVGESDRLDTLLTRDLGVIRAFVHGGNKVKGKSASATDALCYSSFTVAKNKETYSISEVTPIEVFFDLRGDIEKLSLAQYFCEVAGALVVENEPAEEPLRLILNALYLLTKDLRPAVQIKAVFELRMMTLAGFMPDLTACALCGEEPQGNVVFRPTEGTIACDACSREGGIPLSAGVLAAMRHIVSAPLERLFAFEMAPEGLKALGDVTEKYLLTHSERRFTALAFYHSL
ncbi:MAG: DNA repair protein RecO [Clostridia bacterium]|nr:DNA repair protein RecO [Clostridia bacterium]